MRVLVPVDDALFGSAIANFIVNTVGLETCSVLILREKIAGMQRSTEVLDDSNAVQRDIMPVS